LEWLAGPMASVLPLKWCPIMFAPERKGNDRFRHKPGFSQFPLSGRRQGKANIEQAALGRLDLRQHTLIGRPLDEEGQINPTTTVARASGIVRFFPVLRVPQRAGQGQLCAVQREAAGGPCAGAGGRPGEGVQLTPT
jgi:hypothetical protein